MLDRTRIQKEYDPNTWAEEKKADDTDPNGEIYEENAEETDPNGQIDQEIAEVEDPDGTAVDAAAGASSLLLSTSI